MNQSDIFQNEHCISVTIKVTCEFFHIVVVAVVLNTFRYRITIQSVVELLINPFVRIYIYVRKPKTIATPVSIYTYTDFAIEIWGFYQRLTNTLRYHPTSSSHASGLWHPLVSMFTKSEDKWSLLGIVRCFWKITIVGPSSIHRLAWNTTANYGFSALKVKLVDSLI